jgi:hypothetical protein
MMKTSSAGASLLEIILILTVLVIMATLFVPLASGLVDVQRANGESDELKTIYTAIVGDPKSNTFGYLGDVGFYPSSLLDLIQRPASNPPGWNGPYLSDVRIENGILYDQLGGAIEYFHPSLPLPPAVATDQLALISKGPDRSSTNTAANPNQSAGFNGTFPSNSGYPSAISNADNIVYPAFTDNSNLVNYQSLGTVVFNINDFDENSVVANAVNFMPACAGVYDIIISSLTHPNAADPNEAYINYAAGGASLDLLQGSYLAKVMISGSRYTLWQEQISVQPGKTLTRNLWLPGVNSSGILSTVALTINNNSGATLQPQQYGSALGGTIASPGIGTPATRRCARINIQNTATGAAIDSFIMPNFPYTKRYVNGSPTVYTLTVTNTSINTVAIYDDGVLAGTVGMRGNRRAKTFSIKSGDVISIRDDNNTLVEPSFTMTGNITKNY